MSITSSSTISEALAQYNDNLLWEGDMTKAQNCLEAIRFILANRPSRWSSDSESMDYESLKEQEREIKNYLSISTNAISKTSFTQGRMLL